MKRIFIVSLCSFLYFLSVGQVAINTPGTPPDASSMLDVSSTSKGMLIPRMSTAQRTSISSPAKGLLVFADDDNSFWYYNGSQWVDLVSTTSNIWKRNGNDAYASINGNIGIGTTTPNSSARLHVSMGNNVTQGFLVSANLTDIFASVPDLGAGPRLMFYPGKAAFRAGNVDGMQWDNSNVGENSTAMGFNTKASGAYSTALGVNTIAEGVSALSLGYQTSAAENYATAMGHSSRADGFIATAMGDHSAAHTTASTTMGAYTVAKGFASTVMGMYNDSLSLTNETTASATTALFMVGNGDAVNRSNAFIVTKDGRVWLDPNNKNTGNSSANALVFGSYLSSGTSIASKRTVGGNQNGLDFYTASANRVSITAAGDVGIGTDAPSQKLQVVGNICATGTIGACSDIRYKTNILPVSGALSSLLSLHGIYYNWKKEFKDNGFTDARQIGFSAQEVEKLFPEMVQTDAAGYKAVDYSRMAPVLVEAIKEQQKEMKGLRNEIEIQRQDIEVLKKQVANLLRR